MASSERQFDWWLAGAALFLMMVGLVMVYSASAPVALRNYSDPGHYALREGIYALLGVLALAGASRLGPDHIRLLGRLGIWGGLVLLFLVLIPGIGHEAGGARRWIPLMVFTLQPSEPFKVLLVLYLAHFLEKDPERSRRFKGGLFPIFLIYGLGASLLMLEPDFGATVISGSVMMGMIFIAGLPIGWLVVLVVLAVPAVAAAVILEPYRMKRVTSFLNPWDDPQGSDFQLVQSLLSFGNGGLFGTGLGEGKQKQFYLPESHTDFILAVIGEEMGAVWVVLLIGLFALLVWRAMRIAKFHPDRFAGLAAAGLGMLIGVQALINMGMVMGLLPPKGLTLPLVSFGGSSLVITMASVGLLLSFSRGMPALVSASKETGS